MMIRFHLDEHVDDAIAEGLRRLHIDVTTTAEANLIAADDEEHLAFAKVEGRVIVTQDTDFLRLAAAGLTHSGIVFARQRLGVGKILEQLAMIHQYRAVDEMRNCVIYIQKSGSR